VSLRRQQDGEHLERLSAELEFHVTFVQLARSQVCLKSAEAYKPGTGLCFSHANFLAISKRKIPAPLNPVLTKVIDEHDIAALNAF
jgi:hypothetical protein